MSQLYSRIHLPVMCISLFCISCLAFLLYTYFDNILLRMILSFIIVVWIIGCVYIYDYQKNKMMSSQTSRRLWKCLFIFFILQLSYLLFFDPEFSRDRVLLFQNDYLSGLREQWNNHTSLVPFHTIRSMWYVHNFDGYIGQFATLNIIGNIIAFMPAAFFLPLMRLKFRSFFRFAFFLAFIIISVELLQFFTLTGSMDIDDFILNFGGVMTLYILLYATPLRRPLYRLYDMLYNTKVK